MIRKQNYLFILILLLTSVSLQAIANKGKGNHKSEWNLAKKSNGISLYYRWITMGDSIRTREMKAGFTIYSGISAVLKQFSNSESYKTWAAGIKKCNIEKTSDSVWFTHTVMNYPWPLKQKDLVTRYFVQQTNLKAIIKIEAAPEYYSEIKGIERIKNHHGTWYFFTGEKGETKVDYRVILYTKPAFPRFIQDPVVQKLCIDSFADLKYLAEQL
jgi:hypothetical protein